MLRNNLAMSRTSMRGVAPILFELVKPRQVADVSANATRLTDFERYRSMRDFARSSGPFRPRARTLVPLLLAAVVAAGTASVFAGTANAGTTLGASAAEKGRYFGAAVGTYKFNDGTYMSV